MAWDELHAKMIESGFEMDWGAALTSNLMPYLEDAKHILDLGSGQGNDSLRLARAGLQITGVDLSEYAIKFARARTEFANLKIVFKQMDMALGLHFADSSFDAVLANLSLHYFSLERTQFILGEIMRILEPNGTLCFHVNSSEEGEKRRAKGSVVSELEPGFFFEHDGVTRRYFARNDLELLVQDWNILNLETLELKDENGFVRKNCWQVIAKKTQT
jgi:ubiquinone/menaquinone biosynthesis C-methylase UbiE